MQNHKFGLWGTKMFSFLKELFTKKVFEKKFKFALCDNIEQPPENIWYRKAAWKSNNFLVMKTSWSNDWKIFSNEEKVVGVTFENRTVAFLSIGDQEDFKIFFEREINNPVDPLAIKVMGSATINSEQTIYQLGYLSKETSWLLRNEEEIDFRPNTVYLPYQNCSYGLTIKILVRSQRYRNKIFKTK